MIAIVACEACGDVGLVPANLHCRPDTWLVCECEAGDMAAVELAVRFAAIRAPRRQRKGKKIQYKEKRKLMR